MGMESMPPIMSTLNPNASVFVPAARRAVVEESRTPVVEVSRASVVAAPPVPVAEEYSEEWWTLFESDDAFRTQYMSSLSLLSAEDPNAFVEDLAELADFDQFEGYQEHLVDLEEEEILARNLREMDCFLDEDLSLTGANGIKGAELPKEQQLQQQQQRAPWSKNPSHFQNKSMPHKVGSYPRKWNTYRIHQPRSDM